MFGSVVTFLTYVYILAVSRVYIFPIRKSINKNYNFSILFCIFSPVILAVTVLMIVIAFTLSIYYNLHKVKT